MKRDRRAFLLSGYSSGYLQDVGLLRIYFLPFIIYGLSSRKVLLPDERGDTHTAKYRCDIHSLSTVPSRAGTNGQTRKRETEEQTD